MYDKPRYEWNDGCYYFVNAIVFLYFVFTLCKHASYSIGLLHLSNDASYLWQMVHTRSAEESLLDIPEPSAGCGQVLCALVSLEQLLATQNELMRMLMENDACRGVGRLQHPH
jgi:hypothetical protein